MAPSPERQSARMSEIKNVGETWMALNILKCNCVTPLHFKGLTWWNYLFRSVSYAPTRPVVDDRPAVLLKAKEHGGFEQRYLAFVPQRFPETLDTPGCSAGRTDHRVGRVHHCNEQVEHDD